MDDVYNIWKEAEVLYWHQESLLPLYSNFLVFSLVMDATTLVLHLSAAAMLN